MNFVRLCIVYCTLKGGEEEEMKPGRDLQTYYLGYAEMWVSACVCVAQCQIHIYSVTSQLWLLTFYSSGAVQYGKKRLFWQILWFLIDLRFVFIFISFFGKKYKNHDDRKHVFLNLENKICRSGHLHSTTVLHYNAVLSHNFTFITLHLSPMFQQW